MVGSSLSSISALCRRGGKDLVGCKQGGVGGFCILYLVC